jgi:hypothetical protein
LHLRSGRCIISHWIGRVMSLSFLPSGKMTYRTPPEPRSQ